MSVNVEMREAGPGSDEHLEAAWKLKELIRREEGVLKQRKGFFSDAYRRSTVHLIVVNEDEGEKLAGFAAVRRDGYILFLAVDPEFRGHGFGEQLIARVADDNASVTCHARTTNQNALRFYEHMGFEVKRRINNYYEDGGDAYYLKLGNDGGIAQRLSEFMRR